MRLLRGFIEIMQVKYMSQGLVCRRWPGLGSPLLLAVTYSCGSKHWLSRQGTQWGVLSSSSLYFHLGWAHYCLWECRLWSFFLNPVLSICSKWQSAISIEMKWSPCYKYKFPRPTQPQKVWGKFTIIPIILNIPGLFPLCISLWLLTDFWDL